MLFLWEKRMLLVDGPECQKHSVSSPFLNVHNQTSCGGAPSFLLLWLWLLSWMGCNILLTWKEWSNTGRRWGQRWESWMATACRLLEQPQMGMRGRQRGIPVQCRQPVEKRS